MGTKSYRSDMNASTDLQHCRIPKVATLVIFGFSNAKGQQLSCRSYFRVTVNYLRPAKIHDNDNINNYCIAKQHFYPRGAMYRKLKLFDKVVFHFRFN